LAEGGGDGFEHGDGVRLNGVDLSHEGPGESFIVVLWGGIETEVGMEPYIGAAAGTVPEARERGLM
jgi:hypothetical protein